MKLDRYLSDVAQLINPYQWEDVPMGNVMRFDTNTLPFAPTSLYKFLTLLKKGCPINEYADPSYKKLKQLVADYENVDKSMITITNSGDEAIDILAKTFLNPGDYFITTPPTYEMFGIQCGINRGLNLEVPLTGENFLIKGEKIVDEGKKAKVKLIFLVNPNNPTASIIPQETIENIVRNSEAIVVADETYREFYGKTSVPLLKKYKNLVILRSFSKFAALAGARIGYLIADKKLSQKFDAIRFPMGVSFLSYKLAETVLEKDKGWIKKQIVIIKKEREKLASELTRLGLFVYPSRTNFLLVKIGNRASNICTKLKKKGIIIRDRSKKKYLEGCVRITVRSPRENKRLVKVLKEIMVKKVAFLDRDGTLIFEPQDTFQLDSISKLKILEGVIDGLKALVRRGFRLVMISNQDGMGTSSFPKRNFEAPQNRMLSIFKENGIVFDRIFVCPHLPSEKCDCRKPKTGLVKKFLKDNRLDKINSFVCGDRATDKLFAKNISIKFIPMRTNGNFYDALGKGDKI